jgi:hypothetical protein
MSIRFIHVRNIDDPETGSKALFGGLSIAYNYIPEGGQIQYAIAKCGPKYHFNRRLGCKVSAGMLTCMRPTSIQKHVKVVGAVEEETLVETILKHAGLA